MTKENEIEREFNEVFKEYLEYVENTPALKKLSDTMQDGISVLKKINFTPLVEFLADVSSKLPTYEANRKEIAGFFEKNPPLTSYSESSQELREKMKFNDSIERDISKFKNILHRVGADVIDVGKTIESGFRELGKTENDRNLSTSVTKP